MRMLRIFGFLLLLGTVFLIVSVLPQLSSTAASYYNVLNAMDAPQILEDSITTAKNLIQPVNCSTIESIDPINLGRMKSSVPPPTPDSYWVSFSWWDVRLKRPNFKAGKTVMANPTINKIQVLLSKLDPDSVFVDVGANVGFISNHALTLRNLAHVIAIEPISYNVAKLCEGVHAFQDHKVSIYPRRYDIYHAAAGAQYQESISIIRPSDEVGYFDRASLTKDAVNGGQGVVEEQIPLITVDSLLLNSEYSIGLVKLDVQGNEYGVLEGMRDILASHSQRPRFVFYEEEEDMVIKAGYKPGGCQALLESYGYSCEATGTGDVVCEKGSRKEIAAR